MDTTSALPTLADRVLAGDLRAIARASSVIEDESDASAALVTRAAPTSSA